MTQTPQQHEDKPSAVDLRTIHQIMREAKPGERFVVQNVISSQGVTIHCEEAHIIPFETPRGDLAFQCHFHDGSGDTLVISNVDSYLWSIENEQ